MKFEGLQRVDVAPRADRRRGGGETTMRRNNTDHCCFPLLITAKRGKQPNAMMHFFDILQASTLFLENDVLKQWSQLVYARTDESKRNSVPSQMARHLKY